MCRSRAARVLCTVSHTCSVSSGVQCWFLLRLTFWGVVVPQEGHAQVGKTVPEVASTGEAETRISACSRSGFDVVLPTGPPRFLRRVPEIEGL